MRPRRGVGVVLVGLGRLGVDQGDELARAVRRRKRWGGARDDYSWRGPCDGGDDFAPVDWAWFN